MVTQHLLNDICIDALWAFFVHKKGYLLDKVENGDTTFAQ
jgi:hypothetical protein